MEDETDIGPLALSAQLAKVESYVASGVREGARIAVGGRRPQADELAARLVLRADRDDRRRTTTWASCSDEIFGPVVGVMPFSSEEEMIALANDTRYGLASGIWTQDIDRALRFARNVDAGTVWINTYRSAAYMSAEWRLQGERIRPTRRLRRDARSSRA